MSDNESHEEKRRRTKGEGGRVPQLKKDQTLSRLKEFEAQEMERKKKADEERAQKNHIQHGALPAVPATNAYHRVADKFAKGNDVIQKKQKAAMVRKQQLAYAKKLKRREQGDEEEEEEEEEDAEDEAEDEEEDEEAEEEEEEEEDDS